MIKKKCLKKNIPNHIAIVLDGNGRWAKKRGLSRSIGHYYGAMNISKIISCAINNKINILSLFCFSCDNFKRPQEEIDYLFSLPLKLLDDNKINQIVNSGVKLNFIGSRDKINKEVLALFDKLTQLTKNNNVINVNICVNYSSTYELNNLLNNKVTSINNNLLINEDVDLFIRPGARKRLSDFLIYQSRYAEIYFSNKYWPAFNNRNFNQALKFYSKQVRTFGGLK